MNKNIWGKYFWNTIHIAALSYPSNPTPEDSETYTKFFNIIGDVLPCKKCSMNYKRHLVEIPIFQYLENKQELFKWTILLHNIVNRELGRSQWNIEYAQMYYMNLEDHQKQKDLKVSDDKKADKECNRFEAKNYHIPYIMITINIIICFIILHLLLKYYEL